MMIQKLFPSGRNVLNDQQKWQLANLVKSHEGRITHEKPTRAALAEEFSKVLGFTISAANIKTAAITAGVTWTPPRPPRDGKKSSRSQVLARIEALERQVDELMRARTGLERQVTGPATA